MKVPLCPASERVGTVHAALESELKVKTTSPESGMSMRPDGSGRRMLLLPRGYPHKARGFFPYAGSSKKARVIYSAQRVPGLP